MKVETLHVAGFKPAIEAMRNPMNSWDRSDSKVLISDNPYVAPGMIIGEKDEDLSRKLQTAGPEHCKHLRMIICWANITAPRYWWTEFDTYRNGVEKVSCSTMHKLMSRPLTADDFEHENGSEDSLSYVIQQINGRMENYKALTENGKTENAKAVWREIIQLLPQSYLQKRTVMMSYAALRSMIRQRQGHKLKEWHQFIEWAMGLPANWMIFE